MKTEYVTTNIRLPREELKRLKRLALSRETSVSALLRQVVDRELASSLETAPQKKISLSEGLAKIAVRTGHTDLSRRVDEIVYGLPPRKK